MKLKSIDLYQELKKVRSKQVKPKIIDEVNSILNSELDLEKDIQLRLSGGRFTDIKLELLDSENIYSLEQIKHLCIKYRLRFLDSKQYKGEIPFEAISKVKSLEKQFNTSLEGFKVVAPKQLFKLEDKDSDPLLFLQLNNEQFYFIHKWGGEINPFRALVARPMRNFMSLFCFLAVLALLFTTAIPTSSMYVFAFLLVHSFIAICGIACLLIFTFRENFSEIEWDSKYYS